VTFYGEFQYKTDSH